MGMHVTEHCEVGGATFQLLAALRIIRLLSFSSLFLLLGTHPHIGMRGEFFDPEILEMAQSSELHRRMSWIMAESRVPWENEEMVWCCPECFIIFSMNVFKVRIAFSF